MKNLFILLVLLVLVIGFQNCSKVKFDDIKSKNTSGDLSQDESYDDIIDLEDPDEQASNDQESEEESEDDFSDTVAECANVQNKVFVELPAGSSIRGTVGINRVKSNHIVDITNTVGALRLLGIGDDAVVDSINNSIGSMIICNMDISILGASVGSLRVYGGNIGKVTGNHVGSIRVYNGSIGEVTNNKGRITVRNGNIGDITNQTGAIRVYNGAVTGNVTNMKGNLKVK